MYYHTAILLLFRPFVKLEIIGSGVSPRDICLQAADAISTLVKSYSELYTLRRTPSFVPFFVLTACLAHAVAFGNSRCDSEKLRQGIADLKELASCHGFSNRALEIVHFLIKHWGIQGIVEDGGEKEEGICKPRSTSLNLFCPNVRSFDMMTGIGATDGDENPLFWPFPLQGRPLIRIGSHLGGVGFRVLDD